MMIKFDRSWAAIMKPGAADNFFELPEGQALPNFQADADEFSLSNAWWLSEISRLIYRQGTDEISGGVYAFRRTRSEVLQSVFLEETNFFNNGSTQCAIVRPVQSAVQFFDNDFAVLVFRGTNSFENWLSNLNTVQVPWPNGGQVHNGFKNEFLSIWPEVAEVLSGIEVPIFITGHSLGGALASLAASVFPPRAAYTFGAPKAGDAVFAFGLDAASIYRMTNHRDIVPAVPPSRIPFDYCHVGEHRHFENGGSKKTGAFENFSILDLKTRISQHSYQLIRHRLKEPPDFLSDHAPVNYSVHLSKALFPESYAAVSAAHRLSALELQEVLNDADNGTGADSGNAAAVPNVLPDR